MAAEAQLDAITAVGLPMRQSDTALLCRFLRECAVEAMALEATALEATAMPPLAASSGWGGMGEDAAQTA